MSSNDYHFVDRWRVQGRVEEVDQILSDADQLTRWWPSVYLKMRLVHPGDETGVGAVAEAVVKGWLPYTLHLFFHTTDTQHPYGFGLDVTGDFSGRGVWSFEQDGEWVNITYDWKIRADKPLLRYGSLMLRPLFASNHHWCMKRGEESLRGELAHRRTLPEKERSASAQGSASFDNMYRKEE